MTLSLINGDTLTLTLWLIFAMTLVAFSAGFMDAIVGGGGLIMVPAMLAFLPTVPIPVLFGTNKLASVAGTTTSSIRYAKSVPLQWQWLIGGFLLSLLCAVAGGKLATMVSPQVFRPLILIFLLLVMVLHFRPVRASQADVPSPIHPSRWRGDWGLMLTSAVIGFYDGFIGPGTGVFLIFMFVRVFRLTFLQASAHAKVVNMASNLGALIYFLPQGLVIWPLALGLGIANMSGAYLGSHMAIQKGSNFIQLIFRIMVFALLGKFAWDTAKLFFE